MSRSSPIGPRLALVKLGGSLITDKAGHEQVRTKVLERLAGELRAGLANRAGALVLGHGSGSFGHSVATLGGWSSADDVPSIEVLARTQDAAARLHRSVISALLDAGLAPFSVVPSSLMVSRNGRLVGLNVEPLLAALDVGLLPVVFGDVILDWRDRGKVFSTERVFLSVAPALLARGFRVEAAYWLGNTDGILDPAGESISRVDASNASAVRATLSRASAPAGTAAEVSDVTGGMLHRLESALELSRLGIPSWILNGQMPDLLARALSSEKALGGTAVLPE